MKLLSFLSSKICNMFVYYATDLEEGYFSQVWIVTRLFMLIT